MAENRPIILAHRGFSATAPENTMVAFEAARLAGADGVELDVQSTKDGFLVVIHDEKVNRTTNGRGWVKDYRYQELKHLDAGSWFSPRYFGEPIPLLTDVLEWAYTHRMLVNIELKTSIVEYPDLERKTLEAIHACKVMDQVLISSFNHYSLANCKAIDSNIRIGLLYERGKIQPLPYTLNMGAVAIHPNVSDVHPELVSQNHQHHIMVNPWTVNHIPDIKRMLYLKVDSIITNHPDRVRSLL